MAVKLNELEVTGTRWKAPSEDYPQGSFINGTGQGKRDGSYAKAEWANDIFGAFGAILKNGGQTPNGQVETANNSQVFNALKAIIKNDIDTLGGDPSAVASGTVDAITATFTKPVALEGGKLVKVRAIGANTSPTVTFNPNGLGAKPVVKGNDAPLAVGDIAGAGYWITMIYDATLQKWVLQNPATGVTLVLPEASTSTKGIIQVASSAEVANGQDKTKAVTPFDLMQNFLSAATQTLTPEQKAQIVQNLVGTFLPLTGGTVTGDIKFNVGKIVGFEYEDGTKEETLLTAEKPDGTKGAFLSLRADAGTSSDEKGSFYLTANGASAIRGLYGTTSGLLQWDGKDVDRIDSSGETWIRYVNGIQVCWGQIPELGKDKQVTLPVPYKDMLYQVIPSVMWSDVSNLPIVGQYRNTTTSFNVIRSNEYAFISWLTIGRWK